MAISNLTSYWRAGDHFYIRWGDRQRTRTPPIRQIATIMRDGELASEVGYTPDEYDQPCLIGN